MPLPDLYGELAPWFHLLTSPEQDDYAKEAALVMSLLREHVDGPVTTLLELGAGGGNTASHLKRDLVLTLTDLSPRMLDESRRINPEAEHLVGDMRTLRLGRTFDGVLVHDAVSYLTTEEDLRAAFETSFVHLRPGGVAVFAPDNVREDIDLGTKEGGHDGRDGRALRYLEWTTDPDPSDTTYNVDFAMLLREADGSVTVRHDLHVLGLFSRQTWLDLLTGVGFEAHTLSDPWERDVFVGKRPS
jgi:trans-aconitate methyltransferase